MDEGLGRSVPYTVFTGAAGRILTESLPRPPMSIVLKGNQSSIPDCLESLKPAVMAAELEAVH